MLNLGKMLENVSGLRMQAAADVVAGTITSFRFLSSVSLLLYEFTATSLHNFIFLL